MQRMREDLVFLRQFDDLSKVHDRDPVGDEFDHRQAVRDEQIGQPKLFLQVAQFVEHLALDRNVECADRLVADDEFRVHREGARDADTLALASRKLVRIAEAVFRPEPGPDENLHDVFVEFLFFGDDAVIAHRLANDLADRHARVQASVGVLENNLDAPADARRILLQRLADILAVKEHGSSGRRQKVHERATERRFSAAGLADKPERLSPADGQVDAVDSLHQSDDIPEDALPDREILLQAAHLKDRSVSVSMHRKILLPPDCRRGASTGPRDLREARRAAVLPSNSDPCARSNGHGTCTRSERRADSGRRPE